MDFDFSEEQESIRGLARDILSGEVTLDRIKEIEQSAEWFDRALWAKLAEANLLGLAIPEDLGGMGMGFLELCVLLEEVGRHVVPVPAFASLVLGGLPLAAFGTETQRKDWLPKLAAGELLLSAALTDAGSPDGEAPATTANASGDGFALDGEKRSVPFAALAERILVPASIDGGVAFFLVDPNGHGVEIEASTTSTGEPLATLRLRNAAVPAGARLGDDVDGAAALRWLRERALVAIAAIQVGVSQRALEITAGYVGEREQFGVPIGSFQAVQHRCADGFNDVQAMRWTTWRAAARLAEGISAAREAAVAKFWAAEGGSRVANSGLHLHGGLGSDVDYPIHRYFLWSKSLELALGPATQQLVWLGRDMARTGPQET